LKESKESIHPLEKKNYLPALPKKISKEKYPKDSVQFRKEIPIAVVDGKIPIRKIQKENSFNFSKGKEVFPIINSNFSKIEISSTEMPEKSFQKLEEIISTISDNPFKIENSTEILFIDHRNETGFKEESEKSIFAKEIYENEISVQLQNQTVDLREEEIAKAGILDVSFKGENGKLIVLNLEFFPLYCFCTFS
jgi:hypothetical protein